MRAEHRQTLFTLQKKSWAYVPKCNRNHFQQSLEPQWFPVVTRGYTFCNREGPKSPQSLGYQRISAKLHFRFLGRQSVTAKKRPNPGFPLNINGFCGSGASEARLHFESRSVTREARLNSALSLGSQEVGTISADDVAVTLQKSKCNPGGGEYGAW